MAKLEDHRIYSYLNEPVRLFGLTLDEVALVFVGIGIGLLVEPLFFKSLFFAIGIVGTFLIKRAKKLITGFSLMGFLYWHFGVKGGLPSFWPESHQKVWLS